VQAGETGKAVHHIPHLEAGYFRLPHDHGDIVQTQLLHEVIVLTIVTPG